MEERSRKERGGMDEWECGRVVDYRRKARVGGGSGAEGKMMSK